MHLAYLIVSGFIWAVYGAVYYGDAELLRTSNESDLVSLRGSDKDKI